MKKIYIWLFLWISFVIFITIVKAENNTFNGFSSNNDGTACTWLPLQKAIEEEVKPSYKNPKIYIWWILLLVICWITFKVHKKNKLIKEQLNTNQ